MPQPPSDWWSTDATRWDANEAKQGDPWSKSDPWGGDSSSRPQGTASAVAGPSADTLDGLYADSQGVLHQLTIGKDGIVHVTWPKGEYAPDQGTLRDGVFHLWRLTGTVEQDVLRWSNGSKWTRQSAAAQPSCTETTDAQPSSRTAEANAAAKEQDTRDTAEQALGPAAGDQPNPWQGWATKQNGRPDDADDAWARNGLTAVATADDRSAQTKARWRDFQLYQDWYIKDGILPAKTAKEVEDDEERLFGPGQVRSAEGIDFSLYEQVLTDVSGPRSENLPTITSFDMLFEQYNEYIPLELQNNIRRCGYQHPTPVQKVAIPAALVGRDVMCCAQTGSGKTAAFLVPTLSGMMKHGRATGALQQPFQGPCKPDTLIFSPTRELCLQIFTEAEKFFHKTNFRVVRVYGQEDVKKQIAEVAKGADLCVATPGRLWDFVSSGIVDVTEVNCLVLDEADRMLQMQMDSFMRDVIDKHGMPSKEHRQTMMFSATFSQECQKLAADYLYEHIWMGVGQVGGSACASGTVTQTLVQVAPEDKYDKLIEFIDDFLENRTEGERLLVFTNSKLQAKGLDEKLYEKKFDTGALHGDLRQEEREANLLKFRKGEIDVMIATDLASRGLDISGVSNVLNYDLPHSIDVYVQRIGRTGRIGHRGRATTFISVGKDGTWHDSSAEQLEVLKILPMTMTPAGSSNHVPDWLEAKVAEINGQSWGVRGGDAGQQRADQRAWEPADARSNWETWDRVAAQDGQVQDGNTLPAAKTSADQAPDTQDNWS